MIQSSYLPTAAPAPAPAAAPPATAAPPPMPGAPTGTLGPSPYASLDRPLFTPGHVTVPQSDSDVRALVTQSKGVLDHQDKLHRAGNVHPAQLNAYRHARQAHIESAVAAIQQYHDAHPTPYSTQILDALHSDPNLQITHLKRPSKK